LYLDRLKGAAASFSSYSSDVVANQARAFASIYGQVFKQASMITYINIFQWLSIILVFIVPVVLFAKVYKIKPGEKMQGGGH
jgi:hypothetical protein